MIKFNCVYLDHEGQQQFVQVNSVDTRSAIKEVLLKHPNAKQVTLCKPDDLTDETASN